MLVATSIAEEGLDFRAGNLVVRFDALMTVTGYAADCLILVTAVLTKLPAGTSNRAVGRALPRLATSCSR